MCTASALSWGSAGCCLLSEQLVVTDGNQGGESALSWVRCREVSSQFPPIAVFSAPALAHGLILEAVGSC